MTPSVDPVTDRYMASVQRIPRLPRDEEERLFATFRASGDRRAADRLINAHLREVVFVALKHRFYGIPVGELIAEGNLGLLKALEKFDSSFGTRFGTYCVYWIRAFVVGHVLRSWSLVGSKTGVVRTRLFFRLRRERARLEAMHGPGDAANALLAERLDVSPARLGSLIRRIDGRDVSLDAPASAESSTTLGDQLVSDSNQELRYAESEVRERVEAALRDALPDLDPRERFIVESRWLADSDDELSLADIGRMLGVSRERVRQLETRAKAKLRRALSERHGATPDWLEAAAAA